MSDPGDPTSASRVPRTSSASRRRRAPRVTRTSRYRDGDHLPRRVARARAVAAVHRPRRGLRGRDPQRRARLAPSRPDHLRCRPVVDRGRPVAQRDVRRRQADGRRAAARRRLEDHASAGRSCRSTRAATATAIATLAEEPAQRRLHPNATQRKVLVELARPFMVRGAEVPVTPTNARSRRRSAIRWRRSATRSAISTARRSSRAAASEQRSELVRLAIREGAVAHRGLRVDASRGSCGYGARARYDRPAVSVTVRRRGKSRTSTRPLRGRARACRRSGPPSARSCRERPPCRSARPCESGRCRRPTGAGRVRFERLRLLRRRRSHATPARQRVGRRRSRRRRGRARSREAACGAGSTLKRPS